MTNKEESKKKNPPMVRFLGAFCSLLLIGSLIYILAVGFHYVAILIVAAAVSGLAGPSVASGDGIIEIVIGIIEMVFDGIKAIIEAIISAISSIFGG